MAYNFHVNTVHPTQMVTWFTSFHDAVAAALELFAYVLSSFNLFLAGPFALPEIAPPIGHLQEEGVVRIQTGRLGVNLKQTGSSASSNETAGPGGEYSPYSGKHPHLSDPGDGGQVPSNLKESGQRWRGLASEAGRTTLIYDEGFGFEETQQMGGFFTLAHSDLKPHKIAVTRQV